MELGKSLKRLLRIRLHYIVDEIPEAEFVHRDIWSKVWEELREQVEDKAQINYKWK